MRVGGGGGRECSAAVDEAVAREKHESQKDQSGRTMQEPSVTRPHPLHGVEEKQGERQRDGFSHQRPNIQSLVSRFIGTLSELEVYKCCILVLN